MDAACYDSVDNLIIGVRGGRVFQCDASSGAVLNQSDYQQLGLGAATIVYDSGINRCYAACWNVGHYNVANFSSTRNFYKIIPNTLAVDGAPISFETTFATTIGAGALLAGIASMKNVSGVIYGLAWNSTINPQLCAIRFQASNLTIKTLASFGSIYGYPSFAYANVGGNDRVYIACPDADNVQWWDFTASTSGSGGFDAGLGYVAIEFGGTYLFVTRELQFIDVYDVTGAFQSALNLGNIASGTINTGRSAFNGVNIRRNPYTGLIYVAGGADDSVFTIDPTLGVLSAVKLGFDLPFDFVFTPTKTFAVQQGSVPLKEVT